MIFLLIGYKNLFHWNNLEKKFSPVKTNFSASNHLILGYSEVSGNRKEIMLLLMISLIIFRVSQASWIFSFLIFFFQKIQLEVLHLEIQLILSTVLVWHLKIDPESKKMSESIKNGTKARKTRVWNELRP